MIPLVIVIHVVSFSKSVISAMTSTAVSVPVRAGWWETPWHICEDRLISRAGWAMMEIGVRTVIHAILLTATDKPFQGLYQNWNTATVG